MCLTPSAVPGIASLPKALLRQEVFPGWIKYTYGELSLTVKSYCTGTHPALYYQVFTLESFSNYSIILSCAPQLDHHRQREIVTSFCSSQILAESGSSSHASEIMDE